MKITRKEFKELIVLYREANKKFRDYDKFLADELMEDMLYPMFNWMSEKLELNPEGYDDQLALLAWEDTVKDEQLDEFYDMYLDNHKEQDKYDQALELEWRLSQYEEKKEEEEYNA